MLRHKFELNPIQPYECDNYTKFTVRIKFYIVN